MGLTNTAMGPLHPQANLGGCIPRFIGTDSTSLTIHPYFTILDKEKALPIMADFVERTRNEEGCIYYGWDLVGNKLFCRESYVDGKAVNAHLENVGPCIGAILADGVATLDRIEIHGPA